jgi:DNA-binding MarR family transcriptional regulator
MTSSLRGDIKQRKAFSSLEEEASLNIVRTAVLLEDAFERTLKPYGITGTQYNVLRILRGAGPSGLCRNEVRDRMVRRMPDVTRLLDRMEEAALIVRVRSTEDRREVSATLTKQGRSLVDRLDQIVADEHERTLGHLSDAQLRTLQQLLTQARGNL